MGDEVAGGGGVGEGEFAGVRGWDELVLAVLDRL